MRLKRIFSLPKLEFSSVLRLFKWCSPLAVFRAVRTIVINSLNTVTRWSFRFWSHVGKKVFKRGPSVANGYATTPVVWIGLGCFLQTTFAHSKPRIIFRRTGFTSACYAVNRTAFSNCCSASLASAGNRVSTSDAFNHNFFFGSTMAAINSKNPLARLGFANSFGVCIANLYKHDRTLTRMGAGTQPLMDAGI